ncbi:hypothetical protein E0D97_04040 [Oricola cellulosilytica]|uniref:DUF6460 domain-containing protein n=2 Tax=Oricola cellulosilytica TaxID=1429082 RepID=A0A4R0PJA8_9HYPH|nr:hypothetical protein E0D97_04040 [Oricola cellulosilytica]
MVMKIVFASLLCGAALSLFDLSAADLLAKAGLTPENLLEFAGNALAWAMPNIVLGSMVIVPVWCVAYMLRPPRG